MDDLNKDDDPESGEFYGIKVTEVSDLLVALAERRPLLCDISQSDTRNISSALSILNQTGRSTALRSRANLPENIIQLSNCKFNRTNYLVATFPDSISNPFTVKGFSQEEQLVACPFCGAIRNVKTA